MARGSKKNTAQSNSAKGASAQRKKGRNDAEDRVALKDAPSRGRARARAVEEEAPFEEIDREPRIFDDRTKRDIAGVIVAVLAVVLFLAVVLQPSGFLTSALSSALHLSLGIGAYVLPFILVIVGASLIVRVDRADLPLRLGVGLAMLFFAFMSALSLLTPGASTNGAVLFDANVLASRGGYVGSGIAWALLQLFGEAVGIALLLGVAVSGAVIIGFSLTGAFESLREKGSHSMRAFVPHAMRKTTNFLAFLTKLPTRTIIPMLRLTKIVLRRRSSLPRLASLAAKSAACLPASA